MKLQCKHVSHVQDMVMIMLELSLAVISSFSAGCKQDFCLAVNFCGYFFVFYVQCTDRILITVALTHVLNAQISNGRDDAKQ